MNISDALALVERLQNLPELHEAIEVAVCGMLSSYYKEMYEVEKSEAEIIKAQGFDDDLLSPLLDQKVRIHEKYWSNLSDYYTPCSAGSEPEYMWSSLTNIEILQTGDDDAPLFLFKANKMCVDGSVGASVAFLVKASDSQLSIEHEFFG